MKFDRWEIVQDEAERKLLRYHDSQTGVGSSWIAVWEEPDPDDVERQHGDEVGETWSLWWVAPNAANMEDFERYVLVDLEVVEIG